VSEVEIKIFGLQRSGNNWLSLILKKSYKNVRLMGNDEAGWKHGMYRIPEVLGRECHVIILSKEPYCWLPSIFKYRAGRHEASANFKQFLNGSSSIELYNLMYAHWLDVELREKQKIIIAYETLLADPLLACGWIADCLKLERKTKNLFVPNKHMKKNNTESKRPFDPKYYLERKYMSKFNGEMLEIVNPRIDWELVKRLRHKTSFVGALA